MPSLWEKQKEKRAIGFLSKSWAARLQPTFWFRVWRLPLPPSPSSSLAVHHTRLWPFSSASLCLAFLSLLSGATRFLRSCLQQAAFSPHNLWCYAHNKFNVNSVPFLFFVIFFNPRCKMQDCKVLLWSFYFDHQELLIPFSSRVREAGLASATTLQPVYFVNLLDPGWACATSPCELRLAHSILFNADEEDSHEVKRLSEVERSWWNKLGLCLSNMSFPRLPRKPGEVSFRTVFIKSHYREKFFFPKRALFFVFALGGEKVRAGRGGMFPWSLLARLIYSPCRDSLIEATIQDTFVRLQC